MNGQDIIDFIKKNHLEECEFLALQYPMEPTADIATYELVEDSFDIRDDNTVEIY